MPHIDEYQGRKSPKRIPEKIDSRHPNAREQVIDDSEIYVEHITPKQAYHDGGHHHWEQDQRSHELVSGKPPEKQQSDSQPQRQLDRDGYHHKLRSDQQRMRERLVREEQRVIVQSAESHSLRVRQVLTKKRDDQ